MGRFVRILLWSFSILTVVLAGVAIWADIQLRADHLGPRVAGILTDVGIKGGINKIEATLDGTFNAEGVDLTLKDGTRLKAEFLRGDVSVLRLLGGHVHLAELEGKGFDITLTDGNSSVDKNAAKSDPVNAQADLGLGKFSTGQVALSGRVQLSSDMAVRFNLRSEGLDPQGEVELRAGLAWTGRSAGTLKTDPRADIVARIQFNRTFGQHGLAWREVASDIAKLRLRLVTRDGSALAAGGPQLDLDAENGPNGLVGKIAVRDAKNLNALDGAFTLGESLSVKGKLNLSTGELGILTPTRQTDICQIRGELDLNATPDSWSVATDLAASWNDLSVFSKTIAANTRCEWKIKLAAHGDGKGWSIDSSTIQGPGNIAIVIRKPLNWKSGALPADSSGVPIELSAVDSPLSALAPFLSLSGFVPVNGTWSGAAEIAFAEGEAIVTCPRPLSITELSVEREGVPLLANLNATLPLKADRGGIAIQGFRAGVSGRTLISGDASVRPGKNGAWQSDVRLKVDLGDLAGQPGWESIPFDRLRGIIVDVGASVAATAGAPPVMTQGAVSIRNASVELMNLRQRSPIRLDGTLPVGALFDGKATNLPLESISALVPGLNLTGTLTKAELTLGAKSDGSWYVRSEAGPIQFTDTAVGWAGMPYLEHCDLTTEIDLSFGSVNVLRFEKTDLRCKGRSLATGSAIVPLGGAWPTGSIQGELGALATQPFAKGMGEVAGGNYQISLTSKDQRSVAMEVSVRDAGFRDRVLRINTARLTGSLEREGDVSKILGTFHIGATSTSDGKLSVRVTKNGTRMNWEAKVDITEIALDDILGLSPPETDPAEDKGSDSTDSVPDRSPVWAGHTGTLEFNLTKGTLGELTVRDLTANATLDDNLAKLTSLTGKVLGGTFAGDGSLAFNRTAPSGPYVLNSTLSAANVDFAEIAALLPTMKGNAEGKANARIGVASYAPRVNQLIQHLAIDLAVDGKDGRIRMPRSADALNKKIGDVADVGIGIAALTAAFGKGRAAEQAAKVATQGTALREIHKAASDYQYSRFEARAQRLADGSIKVTRLETTGATLSISAKGTISAEPGKEFADWPIEASAGLRGSGTLGECFTSLGYDSGNPSADGQRQGPAFLASGSINNLQTNLLDALRGAPANDPNPRGSPTTGTPGGGGLLDRLRR